MLHCGGKWGTVAAIRTGAAGLLPPRHPGPLSFRQEPELAFRGTFDYTLDSKNRLTVPAKFRASLADGVVLAKGLERCVAVWTPKEFDAYTTAALADMHPLSPQAEKLNRFFSANSLDAELDAAGRVMVPAF